ncbi:MAG TPA: hypothetical protein VE990_04310 [Acidimicrobiales bacterium]|nr:hypothetical protein [Acidimicrobiales bacterium]
MAESAAKREIVNRCPDCGQLLVRPPEFSAARLVYLHRKWGTCLPGWDEAAARTADGARLRRAVAEDPPSPAGAPARTEPRRRAPA